MAIATNEMAGNDQKWVSSKNIISGRCLGGWALGSRGHLVGVPSDGVQRVAIAYGCPSGQTALPIFVGQEVSLSLPTGHTVAPLRIAGQLRRRGVVGGMNRGF